MSESGTSVTTPEGIEYVRLAALKGRITLESKGLKFSGGSTRAKIAKELGLKPRDKHELFIAELRRRMDNLVYEARVTALESEGLSRSDAQAVVEAEDLASEFNATPPSTTLKGITL